MKTSLDIWTWARAGPVRRLALWLAISAVVVAAGQLVGYVSGLGFDLLSPKSGRTILGLVLLGAALVVMGRSERPLGVFGLAIGDRWARHVMIGLTVGAGLLMTQTFLALVAGAWTLQPIDAGRWLGTLGKAVAGAPLAVSASVVYAGFVAGSLRERFGANSAALGAGLAFGLFHLLLADPNAPGDPRVTAATLALLVVIAAQARFITGDLALAAGFLIGVILVERFVRKAPALGEVESAALARVLAPDRVLLPAPALLGALGVIALALAPRVRRTAPGDVRHLHISHGFLRTYPFATMGALAPIDVWMRELTRAHFRIGGVYIPRLIATLALSTINTILSLPERVLIPLFTRRRCVPSPVFILGVHRSGTTHLHNLIALDPAFIAPTTWQVMNPHGFLISGWLLKPVFALFAPWRRPMDAVRFGLSTPAEEEFAVANMGGVSPDWSFRLPRAADHYDCFCFPDQMTDAQRHRFGALHTRFLRAVTMYTRRRPLLKSPHNTGRLAFLADLYPGARFIHIRRDPDAVYRSNLNIARTAHALFQLQDPSAGGAYADRFPDLYRAMEDRFYADADARAWAGVVEVRYEDLVADPERVIRQIYDGLDLAWTGTYELRLRDTLARLSGYTPSAHRGLTDEQRARLHAALGDLLDRWSRADNPTTVGARSPRAAPAK